MSSKWWSRRQTAQRKIRQERVIESAAAATFESLEDRRLLAVFTVVNTADSGTGSLRWAIDSSNNTAGVDTIAFNITASDKTIHVLSQLPGIYDAAIVDGTTQPGYAGKPLVRVDGTGTDGSTDGIKLYGDDVFKGLDVTGFGGQGVTTLPRTGYGPNTITNNWIGVDLSGAAAGNQIHGIGVYTAGNTITNNVVSSNGGDGIFTLGNLFGTGIGGEIIQNNYVGTDPTGLLARGNGSDGIVAQESPGNSILNNVSSANGHDGILLTGAGSANNIVKGNTVGLGADGNTSIGNSWYGIEVSGPSNTVGGTAVGDRNIFSANGYAGIVIYTTNAHDNVFAGNFVGTDATGTLARGNVQQGIAVTQQGTKVGGNNVIGGAGAGNLVAGNVGLGLGIFPGVGETVTGNVFGKDINGKALANGGGDTFVSTDSTSITMGVNNGPIPNAPTTAAAPVLQSAVSVRVHNGVPYSIDLPLTGTTGVECRQLSGGVTVVLTFDKPISSAIAAVTSGTATLLGTATPSGNAVYVNLGSVANAQTLTVTLTNIVATDGGKASSAAVSFRVLEGDVNGNGVVSGADVSLVKYYVGSPVTASNFREDVSANGVISGSDVSIVKYNVGGMVASAQTLAVAPLITPQTAPAPYTTTVSSFLRSSSALW